MNKFLLLLFCVATVSVAIFVLSGCNAFSPSAGADNDDGGTDVVYPPDDENPTNPDKPLPETYEVKFVVDGETIAVEKYILGGGKISEPKIPYKKGYTAKWENYTLSGGNITVNAIYTPLVYTITYFLENSETLVITCTVENYSELVPEIPSRYGYEGKWVYSVNKDGEGYVAKAEYTLKNYTLNFYVDDVLHYTTTCNLENCEYLPAIPKKPHFTAEWEEVKFDGDPIRVNAVYTPIEYTITFKALGKIVGECTYTVTESNVTAPPVPAIQHYSGEWETYCANGGNITVNAIYTPITYTAEFYADGVLVAAVPYTVEKLGGKIPEVPVKAGYAGVWEKYELCGGDKRISAIYTPIKGTEGLVYERIGAGWAVTGYSGAETDIVIPAVYQGLPVTEISAEAFSRSNLTNITLHENLEVIGESAFYVCTSLKEVVMPKSLKVIGSRAFAGCVNLERIIYTGEPPQIGDKAFYGCDKLTIEDISLNEYRLDIIVRYCCNLTEIML